MSRRRSPQPACGRDRAARTRDGRRVGAAATSVDQDRRDRFDRFIQYARRPLPIASIASFTTHADPSPSLRSLHSFALSPNDTARFVTRECRPKRGTLEDMRAMRTANAPLRTTLMDSHCEVSFGEGRSVRGVDDGEGSACERTAHCVTREYRSGAVCVRSHRGRNVVTSRPYGASPVGAGLLAAGSVARIPRASVS